MGPPGRHPPLPAVLRPVRQGLAAGRDPRPDLGGAGGLAGRRPQARGPRPVDRLVPRAEAAPPAPSGPEFKVRCAARLARREPRVAGARPEPAAAGGRHAGGAWLPGPARRNVHRPGALCRHLLPGRQLALAGPHLRLRAPAGTGAATAGPRRFSCTNCSPMPRTG